jgi:ectoine hydroxylase-related dioxygenase (phytanoyl-CoA dioxygenase family)
MDLYCFDDFVTTKYNLRETLNNFGVAIIPNVLNGKECEEMNNEIWNFFESVSATWRTPVNRNNEKSWREIYKLFPLHGMLFQHWNVGHCQASWNLRQNPKIVDIFSKYWETDDLLVSFDGLSFGMSPEITGKGWHTSDWFHTDQSYVRNNLECIQSWATGLDVEEGDATLAILVGSHKYHDKFAKKFGIDNKSDWYRLNDKEIEFYVENGCYKKLICCPAGSMVFWDSRTVHCGTGPIKGRKNPKNRSVIYLCYTPKKKCSESGLRKRIDAFNNQRTTNHWPHKPKLFPEYPRTYGNPLPTIAKTNKPQLTDVGRKLI